MSEWRQWSDPLTGAWCLTVRVEPVDMVGMTREQARMLRQAGELIEAALAPVDASKEAGPDGR